MRLDRALVDQGLVATRARARDLILRGQVRVDGQVCQKPAQLISHEVLAADDFPWVSRAGLKLADALTQTGLDPNGQVCLDLGASTGGFSQVLLAHGALQVTAVDVGTDQLHVSLRQDPRLINRPQTDVRSLRACDFNPLPTLLVSDLSFIALHKALGPALDLASVQAHLIVLVKPQFEVGRQNLGAGGVVRDPEQAAAAVAQVCHWLSQQGWDPYAQGPAVVAGGDGNQETWVAAKKR